MEAMNKIKDRITGIFSPDGIFNSWARKKTSRGITSVLRTYIIICLSFVVLYPLFYMISIAFRDVSEILDPAVVWVPKTWTLENIIETMDKVNYKVTLKNSAFNSLLSTIFQIISCSLAGYGFARFNFKGRKIFFAGVLLSIIVPMQTVAIPMFMQVKFFDFFGIGSLIGMITGTPLTLSLYNTPWSMLLPAILGNGIRGGLYIYIFRQFFRGMPMELEDAANIDGCGFISTFTRIIIPLARPPMLVVFILSVIWYWNDIFISSLFYSKAQTLAMAVDGMAARFALEYDIYQVQIFQQAGCLLMIVPVLLMYLFLQKYFMRSIDQTGLK